MTLRTFRDQVKRLVRDDANALDDPTDYNNAIKAALKTYSIMRPRAVSQDVNAGANGLLLTASITNFDVGNFEKMCIEYPVVDSYAEPEYLDRSTYRLYQSPAGLAIRFNYPPSASQSIRVTHAVAHILPVDVNGDPDDDGEMTVLSSDLEALSNEAAAVCAEMLAAEFRKTADKSTGADFVSFTTKSGEYAKGAKLHHEAFKSYMDASMGQGRGSFRVVRS